MSLEQWLDFSTQRLGAAGLSPSNALYQTLQELVENLSEVRPGRMFRPPPSLTAGFGAGAGDGLILSMEQFREIKQGHMSPERRLNSPEARCREKERHHRISMAKLRLERELRERREDQLLKKVEVKSPPPVHPPDPD